LYRKGFSQTEIAMKLDVSRQAIHKTLDKANTRILRALLDAAETNKLDIRKVDPVKGVLIGYSHGFRTKVFLVYSEKEGVQLWYEHKGQCEGCQRLEECTQKLLKTANEWEINLSKDEKSLSPTLLAEKLFSGVSEQK
jgi:transcriptional regulator